LDTGSSQGLTEAGKTNLIVGFLHEWHIHVPIEMLTKEMKRLDSDSPGWRTVPAATGQPHRFE